MKNKTIRLFAVTQGFILIILLCLTLGNEILDIPHYIFNDTPTLFPQRIGEIYIELLIFFIIVTVEMALFLKFYKQIRVLEGFISICANCKKIKNNQDRWEQMEKYITEHSLARFSHSLCPECIRKLYPDYYWRKVLKKN